MVGLSFREPLFPHPLNVHKVTYFHGIASLPVQSTWNSGGSLNGVLSSFWRSQWLLWGAGWGRECLLFRGRRDSLGLEKHLVYTHESEAQGPPGLITDSEVVRDTSTCGPES